MTSGRLLRTTQAERNDAAKVLGVHPDTVMSWLERGILKSLDPTEIEALRRVIYGEASDVKPLHARRWLLLRVRIENKAGRWLVRLGHRLEWDARGRVAAAVNEWKGKSDDSPFTVPPLECRECGRSDRHVYCWRWLETLRLLLGGDPVAHK